VLTSLSSIALAIYLLIICLMALQSLFNLRMQLFIWGEPRRALFNQPPVAFAEPKISFTVLLPARHEEAVIGATIEKICRANYPRDLLQVLVICEAGDIGTINTVHAKLAEPGKEHVRLIVFSDTPINKPHGLNKGLQAAAMDVVTIFDAEDEPHEDIFQIINTTLAQEDVEVVQGGVRLMNYDTYWFSALNVLEYYFWFKSTLHYFGWSGIVPLGGNTVFVKRATLLAAGGWDEQCLTEDAEIGIRLSAAGARIRILCDDDHVTREETPDNVRALVKQRTRWHQGFLQVLLKGDWLRLPTLSQRLLAAYLLAIPFIQGIFALMLPVSLAMMVFVKLPVWLALFTFLPLYVFGAQLVLNVVALAEFIRAQHRGYSPRVFVLSVLGFFPYQWLLAVSAVRAILRQARKQTNWEKTAHVGAHRKVREVA
jgi:cellulose synthase/poly-beta-1,6-N-acetylglucosamine synthase-like glycosyltransferase